jgi:hypothetical protein
MPLSQWPLVIYLAPGISGFKFNAIASNLKHPARPTCGLATGDPKSQARGQIEFGPTHTGTEHRRRLPQWHRNEARGRCSYDGVLPKSASAVNRLWRWRCSDVAVLQIPCLLPAARGIPAAAAGCWRGPGGRGTEGELGKDAPPGLPVIWPHAYL